MSFVNGTASTPEHAPLCSVGCLCFAMARCDDACATSTWIFAEDRDNWGMMHPQCLPCYMLRCSRENCLPCTQDPVVGHEMQAACSYAEAVYRQCQLPFECLGCKQIERVGYAELTFLQGHWGNPRSSLRKTPHATGPVLHSVPGVCG